jgi:hypothetical protein
MDVKYLSEPVEFSFYLRYISLRTFNFKKVVVGMAYIFHGRRAC